ncbi:calmodulin binding protein PICBP [Phoenix dactylifera]|uniref:Calmodulin binding protein PICBP n=1 Tax=Phoenix dactylifera TaxID=42345 RepID=A0A8B7BXT1_PHODC|nr:calmodulin binding protein PICBP [Phoenix dactylifera]
MVQRKAPYRLGSQTKSKKVPVKHERNPSCYQLQDSRNKGGGDTKKKVKSTKISDLESEQVQFDQPTMHKWSSAIKISDQLPNYMKPTSSSDARKEQVKVTSHSPGTSDRIRSPRNLSNLNYSKLSTSSSSPDGSGLKHVKVLKRKPSVRQVRPWMKKSLGIALCPKLNANRATCSSTLKDSKFPKALDLNPGGTEAEGTSVMKVCPYKYCSLNGHRHESLPPLKCFLLSRRKLIKTQKSMKLKGVSPFRKKDPGKDEKEAGTGQAVNSRAPSALEILMEEVANDFFVKIYAKPQKQILESVNCNETCLQVKDDTENPEVLDNLELSKNDGEGAESKEDDGRNVADEIHENNSVICLEDDIDQKTDLSIEDMDVMTIFLEYVNCDQQDEDDEGNSTSLVQKDDAELSLECQVADGLVEDSEDLADGVIKVPAEASEMDLEEDADQFPDNKTDYSEYTDGLGPQFGHLFEDNDIGNGLSLGAEITSVACEIAEADVGSPCVAYEQFAECGHTTASEGISSDRDDVYSDEGKESSAINSASCDDNIQDQSTGSLISKPVEAKLLKENDLGDPPHSKENNSSMSFLGYLEDSKGPEEGRETKPNFPGQDGEGEGSEPINLEARTILDDGSAEQTMLSDGTNEEETMNGEVEDASSLSKVHLSDSNDGSTGRENDAAEVDHNQAEIETKVCEYDDTSEETSILVKIHISFNDLPDEVDTGNKREKSEKDHQEEVNETDDVVQIKDNLEICLTSSKEGPEEDKIINTVAAFSSQDPTEACGRQKPKISIVRKRRTDEEEQMKEFNPRAPNFLPVEPDPEAEQVDLRHQEMDERKNAEEWMIDHALQQTVTKLSSARKRKVALLVEAFETVIPTPMCEQAVQHDGQGFDHTRPIQACS